MAVQRLRGASGVILELERDVRHGGTTFRQNPMKNKQIKKPTHGHGVELGSAVQGLLLVEGGHGGVVCLGGWVVGGWVGDAL